MSEYTPNSRKYKEEQKTSVEKKKVESVVSAPAKIRKKNPASKFADVFVSEDASNVKSYVVMDILIPAIKKLISDIVTDGIDMILYGSTGHSGKKRSGSGNANYVSYRSYSDRRDDRRRDTPSVRSRYAMDDIILPNKGEAEEVLDRMDELMGEYGMVTVADLYDLVGVSCDFTANNYGWTSLREARAERLRTGEYVLNLPKAFPIK